MIDTFIQRLIDEKKVTEDEIKTMIEEEKERNITLKEVSTVWEAAEVLQETGAFAMQKIMELEQKVEELEAENQKLKENQSLINAELGVNLFPWRR